MIRKLIEYLYYRYLKVDAEAQNFNDVEREKVYEELRENDEFKELLRAISKGDIQRYFNANNDKARERIKGEYTRTLYFLQALRKKESFSLKVGVKQTDTKVAGRYA